ncbi:putative plant seed peroxygenase [Helianthus annuus]|nr:putative plant seed peroxygenase [Helianthus annuus]
MKNYKLQGFYVCLEQGKRYPNLLFPINIVNITMGKHGSDSGVYDSHGRIAGLTEWKTLYYLAKDKNGLLEKDIIKVVYDGSLFEKMEAETAKKKHK